MGKEEPGKAKRARITIIKNGPYQVDGPLPLRTGVIKCNEQGQALGWEYGDLIPTGESYTLCRCGKSSKAPFCDGVHSEHGFTGDETTKRESYIEGCDIVDGPNLILSDNYRLCAGARFCDSYGGTWKLAQQSDNPKAREIAIKQAGDCPAGRLVVYDKDTLEPIEPEFKKEIVLVEDPSTGSSGPLWVKAGVEIVSSDGHVYETRNRVTLCRCGRSSNMPFCDGSHINSCDKEHKGK